MAGNGRGHIIALIVIALIVVWAAATLSGVLLGTGLAAAAAFTCSPCVTLDGSLPKDVPAANIVTTIVGTSTVITIPSGVGVLRTPNLFHSFGLFNVAALSVFLLNESSSLAKFAGVALVLAGIVLLRTGRT